jgi:hypothetical protein
VSRASRRSVEVRRRMHDQPDDELAIRATLSWWCLPLDEAARLYACSPRLILSMRKAAICDRLGVRP